MSTSKHESNDLNLEKKHFRAKKTTEGGRCLAPYKPYSQQSCSYRFQAYKQALDERTVYNGDKYKSVGAGKKKIVLIFHRKPAKGEKRWHRKSVDVPKPEAWDVSETSTNFQRSCNKPYWFEAHHIIPHSQLKTAVASVGSGKPNGYKMQLVVRRGLLDEGYNLNHKMNMFILPMATEVAQALRLPKHLGSPSHQDHPRYNQHVESKLSKFFDPVLESKSEHQQKIKYKPVKEKLEKLSKRLRAKIKQLGKKLWATRDDVSVNDINPIKKKKGVESVNV
ncbi:AHH domain-containing protein [Myxococcus sp. AM011]|uniref:AHH domain-containing protein n=1 Tax=Myxococcus sp. AM011 TaxID=2745200 RepID=UPI001595F9C3|nr:AHH domain-containing protein [Myxococcus sp. AM011]NVJ20989.1 AHH domain-containing protein [Myxococcus sp. AM011]